MFEHILFEAVNLKCEILLVLCVEVDRVGVVRIVLFEQIGRAATTAEFDERTEMERMHLRSLICLFVDALARHFSDVHGTPLTVEFDDFTHVIGELYFGEHKVGICLSRNLNTVDSFLP